MTVYEYKEALFHIRRTVNTLAWDGFAVAIADSKAIEKILNDAMNGDLIKHAEDLNQEVTMDTDLLRGAQKCVKWIYKKQ